MDAAVVQKRKLLPLLIGLLVGHGGALGAQTSDGLSEDAFFSEMPVVLSVSRLAQPLRDAPGAVTVIDADMIRKSGARDLAEVLRMVPGFLVAQSYNGAPNAVYHAMAEENPRGLQILVDGRSQYSPLFFGGIAWNLIDVTLDDIDRIEVVRGSNSAAYGSNAFLGVVDIRTRSAHETPGVSVRVGNGDHSVQDRYARIGMRLGGAALRLSAEQARDSGVDEYHDSRNTRRVNLRIDMPIDAANELHFFGGDLDVDQEAGEPTQILNPIRSTASRKSFVGLEWLHSNSDGGAVSVKLTRTRERYSDIFPAVLPLSQFNGLVDRLMAVAPSPPPLFPFSRPLKDIHADINYGAEANREELEFQHTLLPSVHTRIVWGAGWRADRVNSPLFYGTENDVDQHISRLFGNVEWRASDAVVTNLGATWERDSLSNTSLAPRAMVSFHLTPQQTIRLGVSRAHRTPTLIEARANELYRDNDPSAYSGWPVEIERMSSGNLRKETIDTQEIGYLADFRDLNLFLDVRAFKERVKDRIVPVELPLAAPNCDVIGFLNDLVKGASQRPPVVILTGCGAYRDFLNGQDLRISGVEYQLRWKPMSGSEVTINQAFVDLASVANARLVAASQGAAADAVRQMDNSAPEVSSMLRWEQRLPFGLEGSITYYRYGRFQWTKHTSVGPFHRTDWRVAYPFRWSAGRGDVSFMVQGDGGRHAEYRLTGADPTDPRPAPPQYLSPRAWLSLRLEI